MQTLILINPVAGLPRPARLPSDSATTEPLTEYFADLMAGIPGVLPPKDLTEAGPLPVIFVVPPENGLPFRFEAVGAVQGLAEAAVMPWDASEDDLLRPEIPETVAPLTGVLSTSPVHNIGARPDHAAELAPAAAIAVILRPHVPQGATQQSDSLESQRFLAPSQLDWNLSAMSAPNPWHVPAVADGSLTIATIFQKNIPDGTVGEVVGPDKPLSLATIRQLPPSIEIPADVASQLDGGTDTGDARSVERSMASAIAMSATFPAKIPATSTATGTALLWRSGLMAGVDQTEFTEPKVGPDLVPTATRTRDPSALLFRPDGRVALTFRWGDGLVPVQTVHAQPDDPDLEMEIGSSSVSGALLGSGHTPGGIGYPTAPVGLQDLPRLAAQLAGTLVHRADGQTEIALSPEEFGHVRLSMQADAQNPDRMVVMLTFERPETLDLFRRHADQLADALRQAGYSGADISFGRSGGENACDGSEPERPAFTPHDPAKETDGAPNHHRSAIAATGSLDLRL